MIRSSVPILALLGMVFALNNANIPLFAQAELLPLSESIGNETTTIMPWVRDQDALASPSTASPQERDESNNRTISTVFRIGNPKVMRPSAITQTETLQVKIDVPHVVLIEQDCQVEIRNQAGKVIQSIELMAGDLLVFRILFRSAAAVATNIANGILTTQSSQLVLPNGALFSRNSFLANSRKEVTRKINGSDERIIFTEKITVSLPNNSIIGQVMDDVTSYVNIGRKVELDMDQVSFESDKTKVEDVILARFLDNYDLATATIETNVPSNITEKYVGLFLLGLDSYVAKNLKRAFIVQEGDCVIAASVRGIVKMATLDDKDRVIVTIPLYPGTMFMFWSTKFAFTAEHMAAGILVQKPLALEQDARYGAKRFNDGVLLRVGHKEEWSNQTMALLQRRFVAFSSLYVPPGALLAKCTAQPVRDGALITAVEKAPVEFKEVSGGRGWIGIVDMSGTLRPSSV